ncbi:MAG: aminotransferase class V-fold PLP-dependent enzyme [Ruminococcaceae bacterium]|nr:aminotransferase class V-fold PLP-dependent enzyme [Oscillospiraceae bacterium]
MIYLDNAATTYPKPNCVLKSVKRSVSKLGANPGRSGYKMALDTAEAIYEAREAVSSFFNAKSAENIIFTQNCTQALNICIKGLAEKGKNFVCSSLEHNAVSRPLYKLKSRGICDYSVAEIDVNSDKNTVNNFNNLIDENTAAVILTVASNVFGIITPVKMISSLCKSRGVPLILDCAQAAGILKLDCEELGADFLCVAAHKGLYTPAGLGILVINSDIIPDTLSEGGTGSNSLSLSQPDFLPDMFESGTLNTSSIISLSESIRLINKIGLGRIYSHEYLLLKYLEEALSEMKNVKLYTSFSENQRLAPVLSFNINGIPSELVGMKLAKKGVCVRAGYHCSFLAHKSFGTLENGTVRISPSIFTKKGDINFTINCINKLQIK